MPHKGMINMDISRWKNVIKNPTDIYYRFLDEKSITVTKHTHDHWEIFIVLEGRLRHDLNGRTILMNRDTAIIMHPGDIHQLMCDDYKCKILNIVFCEENLIKICGYLSIDTGLFFNLRDAYCMIDSDYIGGICERFPKYAGMADDRNFIVSLKLLAAAVVETVYRNNFDIADSIPDWLSTLLAEFSRAENLEKGMPALNALSGYSHDHLNRIFLKYLNKTTVGYVTDVRLNYAAGLLLRTDKSVSEISCLVGYSSISHFIRIFSRKFGFTPVKYRRRARLPV